MDIKKYKNYYTFIGSVALFLIAALYLGFVYLTWDDDKNGQNYSVEVSLPIVDWQKYSSLSKQYPDDNL